MKATARDGRAIRLGRLVPLAFVICASLSAQTTGVSYFETKIRPLFSSKCQGCHNAAARVAGLDLSSSAGFQKGAGSGPLIAGSGLDNSRLLRAIGYEGAIKMPPSGKLADDEIAALREWVRMGSPWPVDAS